MKIWNHQHSRQVSQIYWEDCVTSGTWNWCFGVMQRLFLNITLTMLPWKRDLAKCWDVSFLCLIWFSLRNKHGEYSMSSWSAGDFCIFISSSGMALSVAFTLSTHHQKLKYCEKSIFCCQLCIARAIEFPLSAQKVGKLAKCVNIMNPDVVRFLFHHLGQLYLYFLWVCHLPVTGVWASVLNLLSVVG